MTEEYLKMIEVLDAAGVVPQREQYDFSLKELNTVFDMFHGFANDHLQEAAKRLQFPPSFVYIRDRNTINAGARNLKEYKLIAFNYPCITEMHEFFKEAVNKIEGEELDKLNALAEKAGVSLFFTFFQYYTIFLYYHEYGHLVQGLSKPDYERKEFVEEEIKPSDVLRYHSEELDADWLATGSLAIHLAQFFKDEDGNFNDSSEDLMNLTSISLAAVFCFFLKVTNGYPPLYYNERSHPHPFVRICYITIFLLQGIAANVPAEVLIDDKVVLSKALKLADTMMSDNITQLHHFAEAFLANKNEIDAYVNQIVDNAAGQKNFCRNQPLDLL